MSRFDKAAIFLCAGLFLACLLVAEWIYEDLPHLEDEMAFVWQARTIASGKISLPSPQPNPNSFIVPFVNDYQGRRFGKYPIGWPVILAAGEKIHLRQIVNPILTGLAFWWIYRLVKKVLDEKTALLAIGLGSISPFVLMNGGSLLSHPWSLLLSVIFVAARLDVFTDTAPAAIRPWLPAVVAGLALGLLALTRPWTAVGIFFPFTFHASFLFLRGNRKTRLLLVGIAILAAATASLYFLWQYAVTGDFLRSPYTIWWPYDRVGFGPEIGPPPAGYKPEDAVTNTLFSLYAGNTDLFGWPVISWLFIPFGLYACRRSLRAWLIGLPLLSLIGAYALYWTPSWIFGPRYFYEALPAPLLLTAAGMRWMAGSAVGKHAGILWHQGGRLRFSLTSLVVGGLVAANLTFYLPARLDGLVGLYSVSRQCITSILNLTANNSTPTLVFVHVQKNFFEYACTIDLNSPFMDSPILTAISRNKEIDSEVANRFPGRTIYHYYPDSKP